MVLPAPENVHSNKSSALDGPESTSQGGMTPPNKHKECNEEGFKRWQDRNLAVAGQAVYIPSLSS